MATARGTRQRKIHAPDIDDISGFSKPEAWVSVQSSRVQRARWDGGLGNIDVIFRDGTPWTYEVGQGNYAVWRNFKRSASKGKYINRVLNQYPYRDRSGDFTGTEAGWRNRG